MARLTPQEAAAKWALRTAAASGDAARGIERVQSAPGQAAARAAEKWHTKVSQAKPKFAANSAAVSLEEWRAAAIAGTSRIASGVEAKKGKQERFMAEFLPHLDRAAAAIAAMPTTTVDQAIAKSAAQIRHNAAFRRGGPR